MKFISTLENEVFTALFLQGKDASEEDTEKKCGIILIIRNTGRGIVLSGITLALKEGLEIM